MKKQNEKRTSFANFLKARNTGRGILSIVLTVLIIAAVILLNVAVTGMSSRYSLYLDTTPNKAYRLQSVTADYAASIEKDVDFYVLAYEQDFEDAGDHYVQANKLIRQFCESSDHIHLHYVDLITDPSFRSAYPDVDWNTPHPCLVVCGKNYRVIEADDMFDYEQDSSGYLYPTNQHIEQALASAVLTVTADYIPTVAVLTGQAEEDASYFTTLLSSNAYNIATVDLTSGTIPEEAEFLLIYAPAVDIDAEMGEYLSEWLTNNGRYGHHIVYFPSELHDVSEYPNLNALLADYGMSLDYGYIREDDTSNIPSILRTPLCARFFYADPLFTNRLQNPGINVFLFCTMPVNIIDSTLASPMLTSSEYSFFGPIKMEGEFEPSYGVFNGAAVGTRNSGSTEENRSSHIVVVGSSRALWESFLTYKAFNNAAYFVNIFNALSSAGNSGVVIEGKNLDSAVLGADNSAMVNFVAALARYVIPAAVLAAGLIIWLIRRHR